MTMLLAWLATYTIHSSALLIAAWLLHRTVVRAPAARDVLWRAALVGGLLTASLQTMLSWRPLGGVVPVSRVQTVAPIREVAPLSVRAPSRVDQAVARPAPAAVSVRRAAPAALPWRLMSVALWAATAAGLLIRLVARRRRLSRELGPREPVSHPEVIALANRLGREAGLGGALQLTRVSGTMSPMALGAREICLPAVALDVPVEELEALLAHEVAHLARRDPLWLGGLNLLECVAFFQPLNRFGRRRLMEAAEYLCDDWVVERTGSGRPLAGCLVRVAEWIDTARRPLPVVGMAEHRSQLVARIHRLLEDRGMTIRPKKTWMLLGAVGLLATTVVVAPAVVVRRPQAPTVSETSNTPKSEKMLLTKLSSTLARVQHEVIRQVADTTHAAIIAALIEALKDEDVQVRRAAAQSLGNREDRRAVPALAQALKDPDTEVRMHAIEALASFEDPRAIDGLIAALRDESAEVREHAAEGLSHFDKEPRAADALASRLDDSSPEVRAKVAQALVEFHDNRAIPALMKSLSDRDAETRQQAVRGLTELKATSALPAIMDRAADENADVRQSVAHALGELQANQAVPALKKMLEDPSSDVREAAIEALSEIRDRAAIDVLVVALKAKDPNVRRRAAAALGER
ncbi:MAG: HEAT repeat domain-containing protein [Gemmatimonadota bacterium]